MPGYTASTLEEETLKFARRNLAVLSGEIRLEKGEEVADTGPCAGRF